MLYEIIEKTNEWKLGDGFLKKAWMRQGVSAEEAQKVLDETRDLRGWEYNRGITVAAAVIFTTTVVIPYVKYKIDEAKWNRKLKKIQDKYDTTENEEESEEAAE